MEIQHCDPDLRCWALFLREAVAFRWQTVLVLQTCQIDHILIFNHHSACGRIKHPGNTGDIGCMAADMLDGASFLDLPHI